jgi:hypothetical protein
MAAKLSDNEYNLLLQNDVNSRGHTQWFFFKVTNTTKDLCVKFNILNLVKGASLYNQGMQVVVYSQHCFVHEGRGWFRGGEQIAYFANNYSREHVSSKYFTMTFSYTFPESQDTVYFAYSVPYSYTQLNQFLKAIEADPVRSQFITRKTLCRTLAGNKCEYLTVTNPGSIDQIQSRRGIVVSARVHPGETVGSWMMHGLIDFLTSAAAEASHLRDLYLIKLVPMLNPDGVVNGNHRTSLTGADLNRRWKQPSKMLHPTIYSMKRMVKSFACTNDLEIICDFHGHSRKKNAFIYGCNLPKEPQATKLFPFVLSKINPNFSFRDCRFGIQKSKEATLRVSLFRELKMPKVYTLEASFAGSDSGPQAYTHFTTKQLEEIGRDFLLAVLVCSSPMIPAEPRHFTPRHNFRGRVMSEVAVLPPTFEVKGAVIDAGSLYRELLQDDALLRAGEAVNSSDDSDSEPSEDNLDDSKLKKLMPKTARTRYRSLPRHGGKRNRLKSTSNIPTVIQKCPDCGDLLTRQHICSAPQPPPAQTPPRKPVGVRTYYNKAGKKVHDQITQTLASDFSRSSWCGFDFKLPSRLVVTNTSVSRRSRRKSTAFLDFSVDVKPLDSPSQDLIRPDFADNAGVVSTRNSGKASKRDFISRLKQRTLSSYRTRGASAQVKGKPRIDQ